MHARISTIRCQRITSLESSLDLLATYKITGGPGKSRGKKVERSLTKTMDRPGQGDLGRAIGTEYGKVD